MAPKPFAERRVADRRSRHEYPDIERRKSAERRVAPARAQREEPGIITWISIALVGLLLVDAFVSHGHYRRLLLESINNEAALLREASGDFWRPTAA